MTLKQDQWIWWPPVSAGVLAGFRVVGDVNVTQGAGCCGGARVELEWSWPGGAGLGRLSRKYRE